MTTTGCGNRLCSSKICVSNNIVSALQPNTAAAFSLIYAVDGPLNLCATSRRHFKESMATSVSEDDENPETTSCADVQDAPPLSFVLDNLEKISSSMEEDSSSLSASSTPRKRLIHALLLDKTLQNESSSPVTASSVSKQKMLMSRRLFRNNLTDN